MTSFKTANEISWIIPVFQVLITGFSIPGPDLSPVVDKIITVGSGLIVAAISVSPHVVTNKCFTSAFNLQLFNKYFTCCFNCVYSRKIGRRYINKIEQRISLYVYVREINVYITAFIELIELHDSLPEDKRNCKAAEYLPILDIHKEAARMLISVPSSLETFHFGLIHWYQHIANAMHNANSLQTAS